MCHFRGYRSSSNCEIKYKIGDKSLNYNVNKINFDAKTLSTSRNYENNQYYGYSNRYSDYFSTIDEYELCDENLKIKVEIFQKYVGSLTEEIKKCTIN